MDKWRGTVVQLTVLIIIGGLAFREPKYIEHAFMILGAVLGANITGAKVSAAFASMLGGNGGSSPPGASMPPRSMTPMSGMPKITGHDSTRMILGAIGAGALFELFRG